MRCSKSNKHITKKFQFHCGLSFVGEYGLNVRLETQKMDIVVSVSATVQRTTITDEGQPKT